MPQETESLDALKSKISALSTEAALGKSSSAALESLAARAIALESQIGALMAEGADISTLQGLLSTVQAIASAAQSAASETKATESREAAEASDSPPDTEERKTSNLSEFLKKALLNEAEAMIASPDKETCNAGHTLLATIRLIEKYGEKLVERALNPGHAMGDSTVKALEDSFFGHALQHETDKSRQETSRKQSDTYLEALKAEAPEAHETALAIREEREALRQAVTQTHEALHEEDSLFGNLFAHEDDETPENTTKPPTPKTERAASEPAYLKEAKKLGEIVRDSGNNKAAERTGKPKPPAALTR